MGLSVLFVFEKLLHIFATTSDGEGICRWLLADAILLRTEVAEPLISSQSG
jgi:hypothetical protein